MPSEALQAKANAVTETIVAETVHAGAKLVRVEAPPGAGKTRLIKHVIAEALASNVSAMVAVQTNAQLVDLAKGLAEELSSGTVGVWASSKARKQFARDLASAGASAHVQLLERTREIGATPVVAAVSAKWAHHASTKLAAQRIEREFELGIIDEAYQMAASGLFKFGRLVRRLALVGDPGQLDPFSEIDTTRWAGLEATALTPGPRAVEALCDVAPRTFALPASLRLDHRAACVVQPCFYPQLPFQAVAGEGDRGLQLGRPPRGDALDEVLSLASTHGWGVLELPGRVTVRDDPEVAASLAELAIRLLKRQATVKAQWPAELREGAPLVASRIAVATAHRDQRDRVMEAVEGTIAAGVVIDTANRLQGREFDVMLAWHPLSGRVEASEFHLDTGRLCVMASRHRQCCVFVCRAGIPALLDDHLPSGERAKGAQDDPEHDGWLAHRQLFELLAPFTIAH